MLSQRERCPVDSRRWNKLVGLVVVGVESPMVKAVGVLLGISPPADAGRGDAGEGACVLGEYHSFSKI